MKFRLVFFLLLILSAVFRAQPLVAEAGENTSVCKGEATEIGTPFAATGGSGGYTYLWEPATSLVDNTIANPTTQNLLTSTMFYLTVTDGNLDMAVDSVFVMVDDRLTCYNIIFYNTFTPNEDGVNDTWTIVNADKFPANTLYIYTRQGTMVYKADSYKNNWKGKGLGEDLPMGTYYYVFDPGGGLDIKRGAVTIVR